MAIAFTNTTGDGFVYAEAGVTGGTTDVPACAAPSSATAGNLLLGFWSYQGTAATHAPVLQNVSTTSVGSQQNTGSLGTAVHVRQAVLGSTPSNCDWNEPTGDDVRDYALMLAVSGIDTGTPIRDFAFSSAVSSGTTYTFPNTGSVNDGDMVVRFLVSVHDDWATADFTSYPGTLIVQDSNTGAFGVALFCSYTTKSGAGTPGTATATGSSGREYVSATVVIAVAGAAAPTITNAAAHYAMLRAAD
jgi:hypothetical protein